MDKPSSPRLEKIRDWWFKATELDVRSLALARVLLGMAMLYLQFQYLLQVPTFFASSAVFPSEAVQFVRGWGDFLSLHRASGNPHFQRFLFAAGMITATALIAGYRPRIMVPLAWYLTASSQSRNPLLMQANDVELRMMLFFMMFIPWGRFEAKVTRSWVNGFLLLQLAMISWFSAALKDGIDWQHGTAIFYLLHAGSFATPLAEALLTSHRKILLYLTWSAPYFEAVLPFLFFCGARARVVSFALLVATSIALGLLFEVGTYSWISVAGATILLPPSFWSWLQRVFKRQWFKVPFVETRNQYLGREEFALAALALSFWANLVYVAPMFQEMNIAPVRALISTLALHQRWTLFVNSNRKDFGFYRIVGHTPDQKIWSLFEEREVSLDNLPERPESTYPTMQWRRSLSSTLREVRGPLGFMGPGLCRELAGKAPSHVQLWQYYRRLKFGLPADFYQRRLLLDYSCTENKVLYDIRIQNNENSGAFPNDGVT